MTRRLCLLLIACLITTCLYPQKRGARTDAALKAAVENYFENYTADNYRPLRKMGVDNCFVDKRSRTIIITANLSFCSQPFTEKLVKRIYADLKAALPKKYAGHKLIIANKDGRTIQHHVSNINREEIDEKRIWTKPESKTLPWVTRTSRPWKAKKGLEGRHFQLSPSHGRLFRDGRWKWQRPYLFCTTEDLYSQSVAIPYLLPMLENAGAVVFTARERDAQRNEAIVDNDNSAGEWGIYKEDSEIGDWKQTPQATGFAVSCLFHEGCVNPFTCGTAKFIKSSKKNHPTASVQWIPRIPERGDYAVYVSYQASQENIPDARYTVHHAGGKTEFAVNQRMGGGTWVYLGTFPFEQGLSAASRVELTNKSDFEGIVCADAVRFGGGMGHIARGDTGVSRFPRNLEAARYYAQWSGFPETVYNSSHDENDYRDDIRVRGNMANHLAGGSVYRPDSTGMGVPLEAAIALHTDAGWRPDGTVYGTLGISTSKGDDENYEFSSGVSRYASGDFIDVVMTSVVNDLSHFLGETWTRRECMDKNYGETRMPDIPSIILEMLSHQSFTDLRYGHDPHFKFVLARAIYKGVLRHTAVYHGIKDCVVQPLPVNSFSALLDETDGSVRLKWRKTDDKTEPTAAPKSYVVYTSINGKGFDNGTVVHDEHAAFEITPGVEYSFKVTAINDGGESFPSETLTVFRAPDSRKKALIINGFTRLSGPAFVCDSTHVGFDIKKDIGVPYHATSAFCGQQLLFDTTNPVKEGKEGYGFSSDELEGRIIPGNTFDYPAVHGRSIAAMGGISYSSASKAAVMKGDVHLRDYDMVDYICGLERDAPHNLVPAKAVDEKMQTLLTDYLDNGGALLLTGSHIGADLRKTAKDRAFAEQTLKIKWEGNSSTDSTNFVTGLMMQFPINRTGSETSYWLQSPDVLMPATDDAFPIFLYGEGTSAGIAHQGPRSRLIVMGFPFECISDEQHRDLAMQALVNFLLNQ